MGMSAQSSRMGLIKFFLFFTFKSRRVLFALIIRAERDVHGQTDLAIDPQDAWSDQSYRSVSDPLSPFQSLKEYNIACVSNLANNLTTEKSKAIERCDRTAIGYHQKYIIPFSTALADVHRILMNTEEVEELDKVKRLKNSCVLWEMLICRSFPQQMQNMA